MSERSALIPLIDALDGVRVADVRAGLASGLVCAVPHGCAWPLRVYELAMLTAQQASEQRVGVEITLVSPASEPLDVFGPDCSRLVADMLAASRQRIEALGVARGFALLGIFLVNVE